MWVRRLPDVTRDSPDAGPFDPVAFKSDAPCWPTVVPDALVGAAIITTGLATVMLAVVAVLQVLLQRRLSLIAEYQARASEVEAHRKQITILDQERVAVAQRARMERDPSDRLGRLDVELGDLRAKVSVGAVDVDRLRERLNKPRFWRRCRRRGAATP